MEILKFTSNTCQPCKIVDKIIKNNLPESIKVDTLNIIDDRDAFDSYGVRNVPTLIFLDDMGEELGRHTGIMTAQDFQKMCEEFNRED